MTFFKSLDYQALAIYVRSQKTYVKTTYDIYDITKGEVLSKPLVITPS